MCVLSYCGDRRERIAGTHNFPSMLGNILRKEQRTRKKTKKQNQQKDVENKKKKSTNVAPVNTEFIQ